MLSPYRVLDLTDERGIVCGQTLADLGADVIAIEPPSGSRARQIGPFAGGDPDPERSLLWWSYSRGKRSVVLDVETEDGRERLKELAQRADIIVTSSEPGAMDAIGLGYEGLRETHPHLIYVAVSPFGANGPRANWAATDLTVWAAGSTMPQVGDPDQPPLRLTIPQSWAHGGALAAVGALVALHDRTRTGRGQFVDVSAQQAVALTSMSQILNVAWNTPQPVRGAAIGRVRTLYETSDGYAVLGNMYGAQAAARTATLMRLVYEAGFIDEETRDIDWSTFLLDVASGALGPETVEKVNEGVAAFAKSITKEQVFEIALEHGLWLAPVSTSADVVNSKQLKARGFWETITVPGGESFTSPGPFVRVEGTDAKDRTVPAIGQHTEEVLADKRPPIQIEPSGPRKLPLEGVKVLDFTWVMAAPAAMRILADWGATIIHIESTKRLDLARTSFIFRNGEVGLENSGWWQNLSMGKKSLTLDLSTPEARDIVLDLAKWADVVAESYAPGQFAKWGYDIDTFRAVNPNIIMLQSSLLGQTGPHSRYAALGTQAAPLMGFWDITGWPDRPPIQPTGAYTDLIAPWYTAAVLLAALDHRNRTGEGTHIDFGQGEAAIQFIAPGLLDYTVNGHVWSRAGNDDLAMAPHGAYATADEGWVAVACRDDAAWQRICAVLGKQGIATDARYATAAARLQHRRDLDGIVEAWTSSLPGIEAERLLQEAGIPAYRVQNSEECLADPQLEARYHFRTIQHPIHGPVTIEGTRLNMSEAEDDVCHHGPLMGEHNDWVLRDVLGYDDARIARIVESGALT